MEFDKSNYQTWMKGRGSLPADVFPPFITVDKKRHDELRNKSSKLDLVPLRKRIDSGMFNEMRGALGFSLRHAQTFFPAYRFLVNEFINDEWLAAVDWHKKFHRDHVIHQPYTVYVGTTLLNDDGAIFGQLKQQQQEEEKQGRRFLDECVSVILDSGNCDYLLEYIRDMGAPEVFWKRGPHGEVSGLMRMLWEWMFVDTFFLAALFHDIGYPWAFVNAIHKGLGPHAPHENPAQQSAEKIARDYGGRLMYYPFNDYRKNAPPAPAWWPGGIERLTREALTRTHGMPGAISLLHLSDLLGMYPSGAAAPARRFCIEWAALAVLMHDLAGVYAEVDDNSGAPVLKVLNPQLRVSFSRDPLSYLLTLSDLIEEFGRPDASFTGPSGGPRSVDFKPRCGKVEVECPDGELVIKYYYESAVDMGNKNTRFIPKEKLLYFDPSRGYLDGAGAGISSVRLEAAHEPAKA